MSEPPNSDSEFYQLALTKMTRVLGAERARRLIGEVLADLGIELSTADDLALFAAALTKLGGFEGAVGAMLSVSAVMKGASVRVPSAALG